MTRIEPYPWWEVHLGAVCYIMYMKLYHRADCCKVTYGTEVSLFNGYAALRDDWGRDYKDCKQGFGPPCITDGELKVWETFVTYAQRDLGKENKPVRWDPGRLATRMRLTVQWELHVLSIAEFRIYGWFQGCPEDYSCQNNAPCVNRECVCRFGYSGMMCEINNARAQMSALRKTCIGEEFVEEVFIAGLPAKACSPKGNPTPCAGARCGGTPTLVKACRRLVECKPEAPPRARLPTAVRIAEFMSLPPTALTPPSPCPPRPRFLSSMVGLATCLLCPLCIGCYWHYYEMDEQGEEEDPAARLARILLQPPRQTSP
jgi:hypothetical protein